MESKDKVELINLAVQKLIEERRNNKDASTQDDQLLINLLSQLESFEGDGVLEEQPGGMAGQEEETSSAVGKVETTGENAGQVGGDGAEISREEIINELRHVKRQNFITHCLLSVMIVLTFAWQLSEVQMIMKVRDGLNHPFKAVGGILGAVFKRPGTNGTNGQDVEEHRQIETPPQSYLKLPELPHMEFPEFGGNGERH